MVACGQWVVDAHGAFVAEVLAPANFLIHRIEESHDIGVRQDDLGVSYVERDR
jgi:hypothetical protein